METAGEKLRRTRERLGMRFRDVEDASQRIAERLGNPEYAIALSRLADIENKGTVPSLFRLYSLAAIYRLEIRQVIGWYGIPVDVPGADLRAARGSATHLTGWEATGAGSEEVDEPGRSAFLKRLHRWGAGATALLAGFDPRRHRFGYIGLDDWSMHPILAPGALVLVDITRRKIAPGGWASESERPIYFLEHRERYTCGWCSVMDGRIFVQPHPASAQLPTIYSVDEIEIVGQVTGWAMLLEAREWRTGQSPRGRSSTAK